MHARPYSFAFVCDDAREPILHTRPLGAVSSHPASTTAPNATVRIRTEPQQQAPHQAQGPDQLR